MIRAKVENGLNAFAQAVVWYGGKFFLDNWFDLKVVGEHHLPHDRPVLLAANHSSHLDGPAVIAAVNRGMNQVYSLAAKDYFFNQSLKGTVCLHVLNMVPFKRRGQSLESIRSCRALMEQNKMLLVFPEGTRSKTGRLQPFKLGTGFLAMQLDIPVVPVHIEGSFRALPKGVKFPRRHPIQVKFGKPIAVADYKIKAQEASNKQICRMMVQDIRASIEKLSQEEVLDPQRGKMPPASILAP